MSIKFPKLPSLKLPAKPKSVAQPKPQQPLQVRDGFERQAQKLGSEAFKVANQPHVPNNGVVKFAADLPDDARQKLAVTDQIVKVMADVPEGARTPPLAEKVKPEDLMVKVMADVPEGVTPGRLGDAVEKMKAPLEKMRGDFPEGTFDRIVKVKMDLPEGS